MAGRRAPPEGTPEYHEWAERYAHLRPDVQAEVARVRASGGGDKSTARPEGARGRARFTGGIIATPEQSRIQIPQTRYAYPYHGQWYNLQEGKWNEYSLTQGLILPTATPTPMPTIPLIYHPAPPSSLPIFTDTPSPMNEETFIPPVCPAPMPGEDCASYSGHSFQQSPPITLPGVLPNAVGVRLEGSLWVPIGGDLNVDLAYFFKSHQLHVFITPGGQGGGGSGLDLSGGILLGWNLPDASAYSGPSLSAGGDIVLGLGAEGEISVGLTSSSEGFPVVLYGGLAGLGSVGSYLTISRTWELVEGAKKWILRRFKGK